MENVKNVIKTTGLTLLGIWNAFTSFLTPYSLFLVILGISGQMRRYDWAMHEGDEGEGVIAGVILLIVWLILVFLPDFVFLKSMRSISQNTDRKNIMRIVIISMIIIMLVGGIYFTITEKLYNVF